MSPAAILATLHTLGAVITVKGDRLRIDGVKLPEELQAEIRAAKADLLRLLTTGESDGRRHVVEAVPFLAMSLDEFRAWDALLEIRVAWLPVTLWIVPTERDIAALVAEGVSRGRIWSVDELTAVAAIGDRTSEIFKTTVHIKLGMNGDVTTEHPAAESLPIRIGRALPIQSPEPTASKAPPAPAGRRPSRP